MPYANNIRNSIGAADGLSSSAFADTKTGPVADCAQAIHALCSAVRDLADEVERLQRKVK